MYIKILFDNARLKGVLKLILILSVVHSLCLYSNLHVPFGLLYGPLLLLIVRKMNVLRLWIHTFPFILFTTLYFVFKTGLKNLDNWNQYYGIYLGVLAISLCTYAIMLTFTKKTNDKSKATIEEEFVQLLLYGCYFAALLIALLALRIGVGIFDVGFDPGSMLFFQLGIFIFLILMFILFYGKNEKRNSRINGLDEATSSVYMEKLEKCIKKTNLYRNPDISLEMLSKETTIPKHHLSKLMNGCIGKNFYQYIAELRVEYALACLKEDSGIKMESLAYDCGFNSKTSFNRYFKKYTGYLPSDYKTKVQHL